MFNTDNTPDFESIIPRLGSTKMDLHLLQTYPVYLTCY